MDGSARRSHTEPRNYLASRRRAEFRNPLASANAQNSMIPSAPSWRGVFFLGLRTTGSSRNRASGLLLALVNMGTEGEATRKMPKTRLGSMGVEGLAVLPVWRQLDHRAC